MPLGLRTRRSDPIWVAIFLWIACQVVYRTYVQGLFDPPTLSIGNTRVALFGITAALDMLFGYVLVRRWCLDQGLDWQRFAPGMVFIVGVGYVLCHWIDIALYSPGDLFDLRVLLDFDSRLSSFGGVYGGSLAALLWLRLRGLRARPYLDALTLGMVGGYLFGRLGCFAIHDHPGIPTTSPLGVVIDGTARHDLGLYELLFLLLLFPFLVVWGRKGRPPAGAVLGVVAMVYAPLRLALDSLRVGEPRWAGLVPGQWMALLTFAVGLLVLRKAKQDPQLPSDNL